MRSSGYPLCFGLKLSLNSFDSIGQYKWCFGNLHESGDEVVSQMAYLLVSSLHATDMMNDYVSVLATTV